MVEDPSGPLAQRVLAAGDDTVRMTPVADDHARVRVCVEMIDKRRHVGQRDAQVGVHEKNDVARGLQHAGAHGEAFAAVVRIFHDGDQRVAAGRRTGRFHRAVAGRFDHYQHLAEARKVRGQAPQFPDRPPDALLLGVGRDDN